MTIKIENLAFEYKSAPVFDNLNAEFKAGKVNYLIGYNGAGKSTLFYIISDLQTKYSGKIEGRPNKKDILYQTQNPVVFGSLTGKDLQDFIFEIANTHEQIVLEELSPHFRELYVRLMNRKVATCR